MIVCWRYAMEITKRAYTTEDDFWRMRAFLREAMAENNLTEKCWHVARLDYARWHVMMNCAKVSLNEVASIWQEGDRIVGIVLPDGGLGEAHIMIRPGFGTHELEAEMIAHAERMLAEEVQGQGRSLCVWTPSDNKLRISLLNERGYARKGAAEMQWEKELPAKLEPSPLPPGYAVRPLGDGLELLERCYSSGLGFHGGDIAVGIENREDPTWYRNIQTAPLYRRDLDLVAVAPDGSIASFCTIWFDDVTRTAYFEPVATIPSKQRMGLGRAVLTEGLIRLSRMGAVKAFVGGYSQGANALYSSVFGPVYNTYEPWCRKLE